MDNNLYEACYVWYEVWNGESEQRGQRGCRSNVVKYCTVLIKTPSNPGFPIGALTLNLLWYQYFVDPYDAGVQEYLGITVLCIQLLARGDNPS